MFVAETLVATGGGPETIEHLFSLEPERLPDVLAWGENRPFSVLLRAIAGPFDALKLVRVTTWFGGGCRDCIHQKAQGMSFVCTPDQEFLLKNGYWFRAVELQPGFRLRTIGEDSCAYEEVKEVIDAGEATSVQTKPRRKRLRPKYVPPEGDLPVYYEGLTEVYGPSIVTGDGYGVTNLHVEHSVVAR